MAATVGDPCGCTTGLSHSNDLELFVRKRGGKRQETARPALDG